MKVFFAAVLLTACVTAKLTKLKDSKGKVIGLYEGELKDGKPHGEGVAWYKFYTGKWRGGLYHRNGVITIPGGASYVGKFKKGSPVSGTLTDIQGAVSKDKLPNVGAVVTRMFGDCKDVSNNLPFKKSRVTVAGKAVDGVYKAKPEGYYIGKVKKGKPVGKGTAYLVSYNGTWSQGKWDDFGKINYPTGYQLRGMFDAGKITWGLLVGYPKGKPVEKLFMGRMDSFKSIKCDSESASNSTAATTPAPTTMPPPTTVPTTSVPTTVPTTPAPTTPTPCKDCLTEEGTRCMFPFTIQGHTFNSCTSLWDTQAWCPTRLDGDGSPIFGSNHFSYCSADCPTIEENPEESACPYQSIGFPDSCQEQLSKKDKRILFLGNSYTSPLCGIVAGLARAAGYNMNYDCQAPGGVHFEWHASNSLGHINNGDWDVVVLQDQSQRPSFPVQQVYYQTLPHTLTLVNAIRAKNNCTLPVFYQTWGKQHGDSQNCGNGNYFCTFEGIQNRLTDSYNTFAYINQPAVVAPAGEAWRSWPNRDELFGGDGSHASAIGTYLTACVMFQTIWGESPVGNSYQPVGNAEALQRQAEMIVNGGNWVYPRTPAGPPCPSCVG